MSIVGLIFFMISILLARIVFRGRPSTVVKPYVLRIARWLSLLSLIFSFISIFIDNKILYIIMFILFIIIVALNLSIQEAYELDREETD